MKWEYKLVVLDELVPPPLSWLGKQAQWREKQVQILNTLGQDGWEAVAMTGEWKVALLKRPIGE